MAWGLIKPRLGRDRQCVELLRLMEKHMDSCVAADLAVALNCFTAAKYSSEHLTPKVVAKAVERCYMQASGHDITRYLYLWSDYGVIAPDLKMHVAGRLIDIAEYPWSCSNAVRALAEQGDDAETIATQLV